MTNVVSLPHPKHAVVNFTTLSVLNTISSKIEQPHANDILYQTVWNIARENPRISYLTSRSLIDAAMKVITKV